MSFSPGKRIEFEREVLARSVTARFPSARRTRGRVLRIAAVVALLAGVVSVGGGFAARTGFFGSERRALARMSTTFINGLADVDAARALEACAESNEGAKKVRDEEQRVFGESLSDPAADAERQLAELRALRSELEAQGVQWSDVTPFAFGGVRARISGDAMKQDLTVLTGEIYFKSAGRVFAVEISAWRCDGQFVIVDVWKGFPMSDSVTDLAAFSAEQAVKLQQEASQARKLAVSYMKQLYTTF